MTKQGITREFSGKARQRAREHFATGIGITKEDVTIAVTPSNQGGIGANLDTTVNGMTALDYASMGQSEAGAKLDTTDSQGRSAVACAVRASHQAP